MVRTLLDETTLADDVRAECDLDDASLARLRAPALCIYGSHSSCRSVGDRLAAVLPEARLVVLDGGHYLPIDAPGPLADTIEEFLRG